MKQAWIYVAVLVAVGIIGFVAAPKASREAGETPGYEDLIPCATLTSFDSTKTLYLSSRHQAKFSDKSGSGMRFETGTWDLVDDDNHIYRIDVDGVVANFTLISAPEGEGCMLAAGTLEASDMRKSWFSALTDPK